MPTHRIVLDTGALVAFWREEKGTDVVRAQLHRGGCVMHEVNVSELCFTLPRKLPNRFTRQSARTMLDMLGVVTVDGFDQEWADAVADIRLAVRELSVGDGVAVALASSLNIPVLTTEKAFDRAAEFAKIERIR